MLARDLPTSVRVMVSGWVGVVTMSPMVAIHDGPSFCRLTRRGRLSVKRTMAAPSGARSNTALVMPRVVSAVSAPTLITAALSNTSHTVSARRNTALGVGTAKGNSIFSASLDWLSAATTGAFGSGAGVRAVAAGTGAGAAAAGDGAAGAGGAAGAVTFGALSGVGVAAGGAGAGGAVAWFARWGTAGGGGPGAGAGA